MAGIQTPSKQHFKVRPKYGGSSPPPPPTFKQGPGLFLLIGITHG